MAMDDGRRQRRFGRGQRRNLLPFRYRHLSNTISCWYCDFKISALNEPLYMLGQRHVRFLRAWFAAGVGFSLACLTVVTLILLWEFPNFLHVVDRNSNLSYLLRSSMFGGISPVWRFSISDFGHVCLSSIISVSAHELGHALAAARSSSLSELVINAMIMVMILKWIRNVMVLVYFLRFVQISSLKLQVLLLILISSEGIKIEYAAVFIAFLFPGALVAFNYDVLETIPRLAALRIYCAGIWHNAVCCLLCGLVLLLLPSFLHPLFIYSDAPLVLDVSPSSHLSGFLSPGDLIYSLDGIRIRNAQEWSSIVARLHERTFQTFNASHNYHFMTANDSNKGYCVPHSMIVLEEESKGVQVSADQFICPPDFTAFTNIPCPSEIIEEEDNQQSKRSLSCLVASEIVKLKKCGEGWMQPPFSNTSHCPCLEEESCLTPVQIPGVSWTEITYSSPYSPGCWNFELGNSCNGSLVFIGDLIAMSQSMKLTSYRPRWPFSKWVMRLPNFLQQIFTCTFHVSLVLALLNSLPVYFLDGEFILESSLCCLNMLSPRMRLGILRSCLIGGSVASVALLIRLFFFMIF